MKKQGEGPDKDIRSMSAEELRLERERLETEQLQFTVGKMRAAKDQRMREAEARQESIEAANAQIVAEQNVCRHKTGGKDLPGILAGDGIKGGYSVLQHTYANGEIGLHCTRCAKAWFRPGSRLQKACAPAEYQKQRADKAERDRQMQEYQTALSWPTWNSPSGTQTHLITEGRASA